MKRVLFLALLTIVILTNTYSQVTVSGTISDKEGYVVPGASINVKGTQTGTISDIDGNFSIEVPNSASILQIHFVGFNSVEISAADAIRIFGGVYDKKAKEEKKLKEEKESEVVQQPQMDYKKALKEYLATLKNDKSCSPFMYAYSKGEDSKVNLPLKETEVEVNIAGMIADVVVRQVFVNNSVDVIESVYVFPGSSQSAIYAMNMQIGKRTLKAKIKEKEEARAIYEQAKSEGKTASLLEQHRPNVFQMDVANILPGDTISVDFRYTETVNALNGEYFYVFPRIVGPRYSTTNEGWVHQQKSQVNADIDFDIKINILSPIPIKEITSDLLKVNIKQEDKRSAELTLDESEKKLNKEDVTIKYRLRGDKIESGILTYEHNEENFFLLMMEPPKKVRKDQVPPREYIIIMDVSGSMNGYPIETSKTLLKKLAESFDSTDVFNIVQFAAGNEAFRPISVAATQSNLKDAFEFINRPSGNGGTELLAGLKTAFNLRVDSGYSTTFIIATDGYVTVENEAFNFIRENLNNANVFCFGIGSGVNRFIIEGIAYAGMGEEYIVTNQAEAEKTAEGLIEQIKHPVLTDIKMEFKGIEIYDIEPAALHDVFSNRPIILCGKYKGDAEGKIRITGKSGRRNTQETFRLRKAKENTALRYLWARNRIKYLSDYAFYFEDKHARNKYVSPDRKQQIINLGLKFNLLTDFTSFVAVDTIVRTKVSSSQIDNTYKQQNYSNPGNIKIRGYSLPKVSGNTISLSSSDVAIEECVVMALGIARTVKSLGHSVSKVDSDELIGSNQFPGIMLRAKTSGLNILRGDNLFAGSKHVELSGQNSVLRSSHPRFTFNNIRIQSSIFANQYLINSNYLNESLPIDPALLESISIAKSGYANYPLENSDMGVFSTHAKDRQYNGFITFNSSYSFDQVGKLPEGISDEQKSLFVKGFTRKNSLFASIKRDKWRINLMGANSKQKSFIPGAESNINSLGFNGKLSFSERLTAKASLYWLNQDAKGLARYSANTGLLYSMMNSTVEQTNLLINNSISSFKQNTILPSFELDYNLIEAIHIRYNISAHLQQFKRTDQFTPGYPAFGEGSVFYSENKMQSINHRPEISFVKYFDNHFIRASVSYDLITMEESYVLSRIGVNIGIHSDADYVNNYNKNIFKAQANYMYRDVLLFNTSYTRIKNNLYEDILNTTYQLSVSTGWIYSESYYLGWLNYAKLSIGYDNIESAPPVFISPATVFAQSLTSSDILYTSNPYKAQYETGLKPENKQRFTLIHTSNLLSSRLRFNLELYQSKTSDLFIPVDVVNNLIGNDGEIISKGINADISYGINLSDWRFEQTIFFSLNRSRVQNLSGNGAVALAGIDGVRSYAMNDRPYGLIISESGETGNPNADWVLSYNNNLEWKGISLSVVTEWKQGGDMWNAHTNSIEDASWFKLSQVKLNYDLPRSIVRKVKMKAISLYLFTNNILTFKKYSGVSPDTHFFSNANSIGVDYYNMPDFKSFGAGLQIKF